MHPCLNLPRSDTDCGSPQMIKLGRVLVIIDTEVDSQAALDRVKQLALLTNFEVRLISYGYSRYLVEGYFFSEMEIPALRSSYLKEKSIILKELSDGLKGCGLEVNAQTLWGDSDQVIIDEINDYQPDLVIHGTKHHTRMGRWFSTNEDWRLIVNCPCPLLLAKNKPWKEHPMILAAVNPDEADRSHALDDKILSVAESVRDSLDGDLIMMHSCSEIPMSGIYPLQARITRGRAFELLGVNHDVPEENRYLMDASPEDGLHDLTRDLDVDLVVMGAVPRNVFHQVFIGNTAERVLDELEADVLVIKSDEFIASHKPARANVA